MSEEDKVNEVQDQDQLQADGLESTSTETEDDSGTTPQESELDTYSKGVQKRIKKLTDKYRKEERDKDEALRLTQQLMQENQQLKGRMKQLDTGYLAEYGTRLQTQTESAKRSYKEAYEAGDSDLMLEAQQQLANIAIEQQRYNTAKARAEVQAQQQQQQQQQQRPAQPAQQQQPAQRQQEVKPDPRAQDWAAKNEWFGKDKIMTTAAYTIHQQLVEDEGFDPQSDEYYSEVNSRMRREFPHKFSTAKKTGGAQVASAGASASRSPKTGRRSVKLTHSQVAIAKKLGVPLAEYAKFVKE